MRLVHWNVSWGSEGWRKVAAELKRRQADIYVLSEVPDNVAARKVAAHVAPDYAVEVVYTFGIVARGAIRDGRWLVATDDLKVYACRWEDGDIALDVLAVDLASSPFMDRAPVLETVHEIMTAERPDMVVGDFNAPRRSWGLASLPEGYRHAYDAAGRGWSYTWPVPLPCIAIDQCICGPGVIPLSFDLDSTWSSDHRLQVLDFALVARPPVTPPVGSP